MDQGSRGRRSYSETEGVFRAAGALGGAGAVHHKTHRTHICVAPGRALQRTLVLSGRPNEALAVVERDVRRCGADTLVIGDDLNLAMLEHADTGVGGSEINADSRDLRHAGVCCVQVWLLS